MTCTLPKLARRGRVARHGELHQTTREAKGRGARVASDEVHHSRGEDHPSPWRVMNRSTDQEMTDMHENTTMPGCDDNILEIALDADPLNDRLSSEIPSEPFEGMDFASIEDVKNYYVRYAKSIV
ncbi:hypothetical protein MTR_6g060130 [Medicago truncatula]|uniref:Uncharacterized protein n=1 Tax=Medicago truncatula TaxID=3880 RepID=G7KMX9_MEDTR|nr:hypothetical protein MTR_6g060130 [Medicago truncatula]